MAHFKQTTNSLIRKSTFMEKMSFNLEIHSDLFLSLYSILIIISLTKRGMTIYVPRTQIFLALLLAGIHKRMVIFSYFKQWQVVGVPSEGLLLSKKYQDPNQTLALSAGLSTIQVLQASGVNMVISVEI